MRKKVLIPLIAAGLVATALMVPTASAQNRKPAPTGVPTSAPTADSCTKLHRSLKAQAKAGKRTAYCTRAAKAVPKTSGFKTAGSLNPLCEQAEGTVGWPENRTETCRVIGETIEAVDVNNGVTIGYMDVWHVDYLSTDTNSNTFHFSFYAKVASILGRGFEDAMIGGNPNCYPTCSMNPWSFQAQSFNSVGATWSVVAGYESDADRPSEIQHLSGWVEWQVYSASDPAKYIDLAAASPHPVQCDFTAEEAEDDPIGTPGCVLDDYRPIFEVWFARYPQFYKHLESALGLGLPSTLTRMINKSRRDDNGRVACPDDWDRPPGFQCDEYPFRSTHEGAAEVLEFDENAFGTTANWCEVYDLPPDAYGAGWHSCMIAADQNWLAGVDLGQFYARNRLIDGDQFQVVLMG
jgi:hypothetical protein